jgi:hypothetical protein
MGVSTNAGETYDHTTIREDIHDALISITPTDTPFMSAIGTRDVDSVNPEWVEVDLASVDTTNYVIEGESAPDNDAPTAGKRLSNYTQLSDKVVEVSSTAQAVNGVGDIQTVAKQMYFKMKELKRDMEQMLVGVNNAAVAGASGTARETASFSAFMISNAERGTGGAAPTLSGTTSGYPNAAATDGTLRAISEDTFNDLLATCWDAGAEPAMALCGSALKQKISGSFTGVNTRYVDAEDKKLSRAVDFYVSDFGEMQIVPSRFIRSRDLFIIDPSMARMGWLQKTKQTPLAKTGHADRKMISCEYALIVDSEKAHGHYADLDASL